MRVAGGIVLWLVATLIGASAAAWFSLAGLGGWIRDRGDVGFHRLHRRSLC